MLRTGGHDAILAALDVGVLTTDAEGRVDYANPAALDLLGVTFAQIQGKTSFDVGWSVIDPDGRTVPLPELPLGQLPPGGEERARDVVLGVYRPRTRDRVWLLVNTVACQRDGERLGVLTSLANISARRAIESGLRRSNLRLERRVAERTAELEETVRKLREEVRWRKEAQRALAEREARFASVVRAMAEGVIVHDADGRIVEANPAASEIFGLPRDVLIGSTSLDPRLGLLDERGQPVPADQHPARVTGRTGIATRDRILGVQRADGRRTWVSMNVEPLGESPTVSLSGVVTTFADVTERHDTQRALEQSLKQLELLTGALPGVFLFQALLRPDGPSEMLYLSSGAESLIGVLPSDCPFPLPALEDRVHPEDRISLRGSLGTEAPSIDREMRVRASTGGDPISGSEPRAPWRWVSVRARPEVTPEGVLFSGTVLDVHEQRRMTEALRETQKLEAVGVLAAGVAHNFNNLLAAIIPNVEQARLQADAELAPYLDDAAEAARSARDLVKQLLVVARKPPNREHQDVDLVRLVQGVVELLRRTLGASLAIHTRLGPTRALVRGSAAHLNQVVLNLCMNARDAVTDREGAKLEVRVDPDGAFWRIEIEDNGEGMSRDVLVRLGEPFFTTKGPDQGTGLGVATAYSIVQDHGGTLAFESIVGRGTVATVRLPRLDHVPPPSESEAAKRRSLTVLVVDDEPSVRRTIAQHLEGEGHLVVEASTGRAAIELVDGPEGATLELAFVDVGLFGPDGLEVLEHIGAVRPKLPVVLLTGLLHEGLTSAGAAAVLQKPVSRDRLLAVVVEIAEAT